MSVPPNTNTDIHNVTVQYHRHALWRSKAVDPKDYKIGGFKLLPDLLIYSFRKQKKGEWDTPQHPTT